MTRARKEPLELQRLRAEHSAADKALGQFIAASGIESAEYLAAEHAKSAAWKKLRDALGLARDFVKNADG
jgi:hypothetical protein